MPTNKNEKQNETRADNLAPNDDLTAEESNASPDQADEAQRFPESSLIASERIVQADNLATNDDLTAERNNGRPVQADEARRSLRNRAIPSFGPIGMIAAGFWVIGFYALLGLGIAAIFSKSVQSFWVTYWYLVIAAVILLIPVSVFMSFLEEKFHALEGEAARKMLTLIAIPSITAVMMGLIFTGSTKYLTIAAQLIIIAVTALLPAVTYFLFLATRRPSILNEFIGNLRQLGLFAPCADSESFAAQKVRIESYFQLFEASYGTLRFDSREREIVTRGSFVEELIETIGENKNYEGQNGKYHRLPQATISIGDIFNANLIIPTGLVTILGTIGWLLVLQPNFGTIETANEIANLKPQYTAVNFAFLGAYFFGIQLLFRRFVRRDLSPNAYLALSNRIILAVIGVWLVGVLYSAGGNVREYGP
jgi:hypothetical protein